VKRVVAVATLAERAAGFDERARRPSEIARRERHLGFRRHASRALHALSRTERACRAAQELPGFRELAELGHGDAAQGERGCVVPQRDPLERAERITRAESACRCRDERVHGSSF
jgi:hypothetical protein